MKPSQYTKRSLALIPALLLALLGVVVIGRAQTCVTPPVGLIAWWPGEGNANDIQGTNNGTPINGATFATGKVGQAFSLNGYVEVPHSTNLSFGPTTPMSFELWAYRTGGGVAQHFLGKRQGDSMNYQLAFDTADGIQFHSSSSHVTTGLAMPVGEWTHLAATFDGSLVRLYVNGELKASSAATLGAPNIAPLQIGNSGGYGAFNGLIDELTFYNRALTTLEIQAIYAAGSAGKCKPCLSPPSGLVAWWAADGNANDGQGTNGGTLVGGAAFAPGKSGLGFSFDGVDDYVVVPDSEAQRSTNITIEGWFNFPRTPVAGGGPADEFILAAKYTNSAGWNLRVSAGLQPSFRVYSFPSTASSAASAITVGTNAWVHLAGTYDGAVARIYVNGVLQGTSSLTGGYTTSSIPMTIGAASWFNGGFTVGRVDELSIYDRALSLTEIQTIYQAGGADRCKAPYILIQPTNQTVIPGSNAIFAVSVPSLPPPSYQWLFNATNFLAGQTNSFLLLTNVSLSEAGIYSVLVSNSLGFVLSSNATLVILSPDGDEDGDGLLNNQEIQFGTNPLLADSDGDGQNDYAELFTHSTHPLLTDTDNDGIPDGWEVQHGLNARFNDAADDLDGDGVANLAEYNWSLSHTNQLIDPRTKYSTSVSTSDYAVVNGAGTNWFLYDRNNRLIGAEFDRGLALAYVYDGNDSLVRQVSMKHDANTNGLPDVWEFVNGLTNNAVAYTDTDGDGWTDYQEWKAGTSPNATNSAPNVLGNPGINIASLTVPFSPSNFVVGVGQLDGLGAEEIVIGADGNPGTNTNFLLVLSQGPTSWSTQRVDVGAFGITSIAVGQLTNRSGAGVYLGLRGTTNGSGRILEFTSNGGVWQSNVVAISTNQEAFVLGVSGQDLLGAMGTTNASDGTLLRFVLQTQSWIPAIESANVSHRGLGVMADNGLNALRLVDPYGIEVSRPVLGGTFGVNPSGTLQNGLNAYFAMDGPNDSVATNAMINNGGVAFNAGLVGNAADFGFSNTARILSSTSNFGLTWASSFTVSLWIKLNAEIASGSWQFWNIIPHAGGSMGVNYQYNGGTRLLGFSRYHNNGIPPEPTEDSDHIDAEMTLGNTKWTHVVMTYDSTNITGYIDGIRVGSVPSDTVPGSGAGYMVGTGIGAYNNGGSFELYSSVKIDEMGIWSRALSALEVNNLYNGGVYQVIPEPPAHSNLVWRGASLAFGFLRGTSGSSIFYAFADDKNANGSIDFADDFVTAEYLVSGTNASLLTLSRQRIASPTTAQSYGLASVNFLNASNEVFFTGEPDGQVFAWTASGATNPLHRQLFSAHHAGKAWHALAGVRALEPGESLIGLRVSPVASNKCDVIFWSPQPQVLQLATLPNTAPAAAVLPATNTLGSLALVTVRLWDAEGNASTPFLQYQISGTTNWQSATLVNASTPIAASPGGVNHIIIWNTQADIGANLVTNILLRARASDMTLLGNWSAGTPFSLDTTIPPGPDSDGDGIPDWWEIQYFGNTNLTANADSDGDGFTNGAEYIADTIPTDNASYLRFTNVSVISQGIKLDWLGGSNAWQYLQRSVSLGDSNELWLSIKTNPPPTPLSGSYTDFFGTNATKFYRIEAIRP